MLTVYRTRLSYHKWEQKASGNVIALLGAPRARDPKRVPRIVIHDVPVGGTDGH